MNRKIPASLRKLVAKRAKYRCEYSLLQEANSFLPFEIDHIISLKHGGGNELENLVYCCPHCNQYKGTDLTTFLSDYRDIQVIFNPRMDDWKANFEIDEGEILARTKKAAATVKLLKFNEPDRLMLRKMLFEIGLYP